MSLIIVLSTSAFAQEKTTLRCDSHPEAKAVELKYSNIQTAAKNLLGKKPNKFIEDRIDYILATSKSCDELMQKTNEFLDKLKSIMLKFEGDFLSYTLVPTPPPNSH